MHQQPPQSFLAVDENSRQPIAIIVCASDSAQNRHRREVTGVAHELANIVGKMPEGVREVSNRGAEQVAQSHSALRNLPQRFFCAHLVESRMRARVRSNFQSGGQPLFDLLAAHERLALLETLVPAIVGSHGATYDITRGSEAILLQKRCRRSRSIGVAVVECKRDVAARAAFIQPPQAFADGHAAEPEAPHRPQLALKFGRAHIQQFEMRALGRLRHVVVAKNG